MAYTPEKPPLAESPEELRARIPGWGVDLDPRDRPAELITHRFSLEDIAEGYHVFSAKLDGIIKPLVVPSAA